MKYLVFLFVFVSSTAFADDARVQIERANVASNIFKNVCFMMHTKTQTEKRLEFLNSKFPKFEAERKKTFLSMFKVENGDAWAAVFPKGNFVIVVDADTTNCHVLAQKADSSQIHSNVKKLHQEASQNLSTVDVLYRAPSDGRVLKSSGFDIKKSGKNIAVVTVSTPYKIEANKPQALMTLAVQ